MTADPSRQLGFYNLKLNCQLWSNTDQGGTLQEHNKLYQLSSAEIKSGVSDTSKIQLKTMRQFSQKLRQCLSNLFQNTDHVHLSI